MKKRLVDIVLVLIFIAGLVILLYPPVSDYLNTRNQGRAIANYNAVLAKTDQQDFDRAWQQAVEYNNELAKRPLSFTLTDEEMQEYMELMNLAGNGMMGHIEIDKLGVDLPLYHTVDDPVLQIGIGHIPGSSLPAGSESQHIALSGHRGLPTSKLFTDLDELEIGDTFVLHIMNKSFAYEVDSIRIVLPHEVEGLEIEQGKDLCTLVTCTPYAINTHRLLVRGHRIEYLDQNNIPADAVRIDPVLVASFISVPIFVILFFVVLRKTSKKRKQTRIERVGDDNE